MMSTETEIEKNRQVAVETTTALIPMPDIPARSAPKAPQISSGAVRVQGLTPEQEIELLECETIIQLGWSAFVEVGAALAKIRNNQLYINEFASFEAYCREKWSYGRNYVDRLISAAQAFKVLMTHGHQIMPEHERQLRPLVGLTPEQANSAWAEAVERAAGQRVTARLVKHVVDRMGFKQNAREARKPPTSYNKARLRKAIDTAIGELLVLVGQNPEHAVLRDRVQTLHRNLQLLLNPVKPGKAPAKN
jgi:hypothetical protein